MSLSARPHEYTPGVVATGDPIVGSPSRRRVDVDGRLSGYVALIGGYDDGTKCWSATDQDGYRLEGPDYLPGAVAQVAANARGEVDPPPAPRPVTASYTVTPAVPSPVQTSTVTSGDVPGIYAVLVTFPGDVSAWAVYQEGDPEAVSSGSAHDTHEDAARYLGRHLRSYRHRTRREDA